MTNELAYLITSVVLGTLVVGYAYFASQNLIATVERHERERKERKRKQFKPAQ
ncbi:MULTISPECIES: hypothetical protein [Phyllobacterium]|jgi:hypothetical protein|uniref:hypothetical protein n=1 Tax=Phyllobacterium TaxID=28100 RepID=UPI0013AF4684|nr:MULTISPECIES: hypothetical protein [Phyllobacterium]UXN63524.1 hypothetical protein N8E89_13140 [Phyllobacterium sp. A18/5-2]